LIDVLAHQPEMIPTAVGSNRPRYIAGVIVVGLTGGIGSGKSTVSALLAARGAEIVDADAITRQLQQAGTPVVERIAERFGDDVVDEHRALIRQRLADIVFNDRQALKDLNAIVHPAVRAEIARRVAELVGTDRIVVLDIPLLTENNVFEMQGKIVVDVPVDLQVERLVRYRGFSEEDARARIGQQAGRDERLANADFVVDNSGTLEELDAQVAELWAWINTLPQLPAEVRPAQSS
jgi:dephospho-CoA kinase